MSTKDEMVNKLGRLHVPDERDKEYPIRPLLSATPQKRGWKYHWPNGWWGNQGNSPQCVAYSWLHWTADGPVTHDGVESPVVNPTNLYNRCQRVDQWPGENYNGTSVRAGAKIMSEENHIKEYRWAWDTQSIIQTIMEIAPMVVGTLWTVDMFSPDKKGMITPTGEVVGGHAYVLNGVNVDRGIYRIKNSWGRNWGNDGYAYIKISDFQKLMEQNGEACVAIPI